MPTYTASGILDGIEYIHDKSGKVVETRFWIKPDGGKKSDCVFHGNVPVEFSGERVAFRNRIKWLWWAPFACRETQRLTATDANLSASTPKSSRIYFGKALDYLLRRLPYE